jgi:hypothetical protein
VGDFAGDDGGTQIAFRTIIGGFDTIMKKEPQDVARIMLSPHPVQ